MQITTSLTSSSLSLDALSLTAEAQQAATKTEGSAVSLSPVTRLAASWNLSELSLQSNSVTMGYRKDGSLAYRVSTSFDLNYRAESVALDVTLPAEALGIEWSADAFKNGPLQLSLDYQLQVGHYSQTIQARTVRPTRDPEEILDDIIKAFRKVVHQKGGKNVHFEFDQEALQSLSGNPEFADLVRMLISLATYMNMLAENQEKKENYTIQISGKGKPYLEVDAKTDLNLEDTQVHINLTITPPAEKVAAGSAAKESGSTDLTA